jgi:hypothetical protein
MFQIMGLGRNYRPGGAVAGLNIDLPLFPPGNAQRRNGGGAGLV